MFSVEGVTKPIKPVLCFWQHLVAEFLLHSVAKQVKKK